METELKLKIAQPDVPRMREHPLLLQHTHAVPTEHELMDVYYDTPRLDLWRGGITLRVRQEGKRWIQTVKTAGASSAGLHERGEWEISLPEPTPRPAEIARQIKPAGIAELLSSASVAEALRPVFTNTVRRTIWQLQFLTGSWSSAHWIWVISIAAGKPLRSASSNSN